MSHNDNAVAALLSASQQIAGCEQYLTACALQIVDGLGSVDQASNSGFTELKQSITKLLDDSNDLAMNLRSVASQVAAAAVRIM